MPERPFQCGEDFTALDCHSRHELRSFRIDKRPRAIAEVVLDYSFRIGRPAAHVPSLKCFEVLTNISRGNVHDGLAWLRTARVLDAQSCECLRWRKCTRYTFLPDSDHWQAEALLTLTRRMEASAIGRELKALNLSEDGDSKQLLLFELPDYHSYTLLDAIAEVSRERVLQSSDEAKEELPKEKVAPPPRQIFREFVPDSGTAPINVSTESYKLPVLNSTEERSRNGNGEVFGRLQIMLGDHIVGWENFWRKQCRERPAEVNECLSDLQLRLIDRTRERIANRSKWLRRVVMAPRNA
ncbi:MAG: hypothetical protein M3O82_01160 [Verrucomicrobiota bacterium]|nr:hypothetical protein [Verrucomicrobiota bacterium]